MFVPRDAGRPEDAATLQIHRFADGHADALAWLIERFTPALWVSARRRLDGHLRGLYDPEDLVQDVWAVALPRLKDLTARDGHVTPVLLRFLASILLNRVRNLMRKHARERQAVAGDPMGRERDERVRELPHDATSIISRVIRHEACERVRRCIERLPPEEQRIVVLRAVEQIPNHEAALILDLAPATVSTRFRRALVRVKEMLPDTFFDDLPIAS